MLQGRYFMLRVSEKNSEERTHGFETPSRGACRHLWKCCQEHQAFFRLMSTGPPPLSPYARFRSHSPPTSSEKHQASIRRNPPPVFQRAPSRRAQRRVVEGQEMIGPFVEKPPMERNPPTNINNCSNSNRHVLNNSSPRSTRSAPWSQSQPRGLYTSSSPRSVRSAGTAPSVSFNLNSDFGFYYFIIYHHFMIFQYRIIYFRILRAFEFFKEFWNPILFFLPISWFIKNSTINL